VQICHRQPASQTNAIQRTGKMRLSRNIAMKVGLLPVKQHQDVAKLAVFQLDIERRRVVLREPFAAN